MSLAWYHFRAPRERLRTWVRLLLPEPYQVLFDLHGPLGGLEPAQRRLRINPAWDPEQVQAWRETAPRLRAWYARLTGMSQAQFEWAAVRAVAAHEAGHARWSGELVEDRALARMVNLLEDERVEQAQVSVWPALRPFFCLVGDAVWCTTEILPGDGQGALLQAILLWRFEHDLPQAMRKLPGLLGPVTSQLWANEIRVRVEAAWRAGSYEQVVDLAREILDLMRDLEPVRAAETAVVAQYADQLRGPRRGRPEPAPFVPSQPEPEPRETPKKTEPEETTDAEEHESALAQDDEEKQTEVSGSDDPPELEAEPEAPEPVEEGADADDGGSVPAEQEPVDDGAPAPDVVDETPEESADTIPDDEEPDQDADLTPECRPKPNPDAEAGRNPDEPEDPLESDIPEPDPDAQTDRSPEEPGDTADTGLPERPDAAGAEAGSEDPDEAESGSPDRSGETTDPEDRAHTATPDSLDPASVYNLGGQLLESPPTPDEAAFHRAPGVTPRPFVELEEQAQPLARRLVARLKRPQPQGGLEFRQMGRRVRGRDVLRRPWTPFRSQTAPGLDVPPMAIQVFADQSGSMGDERSPKLRAARLGVMVLHLACLELEIPHAISLFDDEVLLKDFQDEDEMTRALIAGWVGHTGEEHIDRLLEERGPRLLDRPEPLRLMVVVHDGYPVVDGESDRIRAWIRRHEPEVWTLGVYLAESLEDERVQEELGRMAELFQHLVATDADGFPDKLGDLLLNLGP